MIFDTKVSEVLAFKGSSRVWALPAHASIQTAVQVMHDNSIGCIVVVDCGCVVGVISERECLRQVADEGLVSKRTPLGKLITQEPCTVTLRTTARECFALMAASRVRYLPVVENDELVGLVSIGDIVRAFVDDQRFTIEQLLSYVTGSYGPCNDDQPVVAYRCSIS